MLNEHITSEFYILSIESYSFPNFFFKQKTILGARQMANKIKVLAAKYGEFNSQSLYGGWENWPPQVVLWLPYARCGTNNFFLLIKVRNSIKCNCIYRKFDFIPWFLTMDEPSLQMTTDLYKAKGITTLKQMILSWDTMKVNSNYILKRKYCSNSN